MSILNPISMGGGSWKAVENTSASASAISFPVAFEPSEWLLIRVATATLSGSSTRYITYICESGGTYTEWSLDSSYYRKGGTPTGAYSNGTFTVTRSSSSVQFTTTVGDYVLVYI